MEKLKFFKFNALDFYFQSVGVGDIYTEPEELEFDVETLDNGRYKASLPVSSAYYGYIIGKQGLSKKRLESETKTTLKIPKPGTSGEIVIIGTDTKGVESACRRIIMIVESARQKHQFTHFLSIPLNQASILKAFIEFKERILIELSDCRGVTSSIFQIPEKLHLTIGTLVLMDDREREEAGKLLHSFCKGYNLSGMKESFTIAIQGVEYMNDDPSEVDVLYGKIETNDANGGLQQFLEDMKETFMKHGYMLKQFDSIKLHATLMNTVFRSDNSYVEDVKSEKKQRESFDARQIIKDFLTVKLGEMIVSEIHLSQRYSTASNGYYVPTAVAQLDFE